MGVLGKSGLIHEFNPQLVYSEDASCEPFWDRIYHKAFPNLVNHMLCRGDVKSQRMGIDRVILLSNGQILYIDEKKRRKDRDDILLEYISADTTHAPGWIEKDLAIDYLAYAFMESQRVYLFPWLMLRRAWGNYKTAWINKYKPPIIAQSRGYQTISVAIPIMILKKAISTATTIQL